jgi:DNA polymerase I
VIPTDLPFEEIWLRDFEFIARPGNRPDVVCLVAIELRSGQTLRLWRDGLGARPPHRIDRNALCISFVENAESACHLALGWKRPARVLDLSPVFRNITNGRTTPAGKGLLGALRYYGVDTISAQHKDAMRDRIIQGWPFTPEEREKILDYCASDVKSLELLLPKILADPDFDLGVALYHGEFTSVSAAQEHRGVPIDMEIFSQLSDKRTWRLVRDALVPVRNASYGVFVQGRGGDWTWSMAQFRSYLEREGLLAGWPLTDKGELSTRQKVFDDMAKACPQLEGLRQLRHIRNKMRTVKLAVGTDGRNRTVLWPFKSKTGRTQPKAAKWIYSPAVWLRSLIKPAPGMAVAYIDYSSMEFMIGASLSDGHLGSSNPMLEMYRSGDPYRAFAVQVGAIPAEITTSMMKKPKDHATPNLTIKQLEHYAAVREKYKVMLLAVQYGMQTEALASRLGVPTHEAHGMLDEHRIQFRQYWAWSDDWVQHAIDTGIMRTPLGWMCRTGITEFNERSIRNWPVQAAGADILRIACIMAERHGLRVIAPVHDAVLIEAPTARIDSDVALMREIMRRASRVVLNSEPAGDHEIRTDHTIVKYPDRYRDKRGVEVWDDVMNLLSSIGGRKKIVNG